MGDSSGFIVLIVLGLYFLPSIVADARKHRSSSGVFLLNLFFGWTLLGWVLALIWAVSGDRDPRAPPPRGMRQCPSCFGEIDTRATVCRHCRRPLNE